MKRIYSILFWLALVSCGHDYSEFKLQNSVQIKQQNQVCINIKECFYFSADSSLNQLFMYYSKAEGGKMKLIDSVDFSPYKSTIHSFPSQNKDSYIVLWETEYEYEPLIYAYYITRGTNIKMGELSISLACQSCESVLYPMEDIRIIKEGEEIEFSFLKDVYYRAGSGAVRQLYKARGVNMYLQYRNERIKVPCN